MPGKVKLENLLKSAAVALTLAPWRALAATQDTATRCTNFKSQFKGIFDWVPNDYCTASGLALYVTKIILTLSGTVTIIFLMLGGFWYLTSAGNEEQAEKGRSIITNSIIGLIVVMLAYTIVAIVSNTVTKGS